MIKNKLYIILYYIHIKYYFRGKCNYKNNKTYLFNYYI